MFARSSQWFRLLTASSRSRRRSARRLRKRGSPLRLELLEDRTLLTAGDLDPTFGLGGKTITGFEGPVDASALRTAIQADGKIVVIGHASNVEGSYLITRYESHGGPDHTFGIAGQVFTDFGNHYGGAAAGVAVQPDGKIVVVGTMDINPQSSAYVVERYQPDGSLDRSFGVTGKTTDLDGVSQPYAVALQGDGKIVVVLRVATSDAFGVARYNPDGSLDSSFGTGGKVNTFVKGSLELPAGVAIQRDGKIVIGGSVLEGSSTLYALIRYNLDGSLDMGFGVGGKVTAGFAGDLSSVQGMALQPDGRIVLAGSGPLRSGPLPDRTSKMILVRFNTNGSVDSSFGTGGQVSTQFATGSLDSANGIIVQEDGKIVTVGSTMSQDSQSSSFALARYNPDGSLDAGFGTGGKVTVNFGRQDEGYAVAPENDGKIVVVGLDAGMVSLFGDVALTRLNSDGSLDTGFGSDGKVTMSLRGHVPTHGSGVALQPDGKIVVAGGMFDLARYNSDGSLDPIFGVVGKVNGTSGTANSVALQADGKIVVVGSIGSGALQTARQSFAVARYRADGSLDPTFGTGGMVTTQLSDADVAYGVAIQSDGKIVVVGMASSRSGDFALARYNSDGTLDPSFGSAGKVTTDFSSGEDSASGVVLQPDGKILVVGSTGNIIPAQLMGTGALAVARYNTDGSLDVTFGSGGQLINRAMGGTGAPSSAFFQPGAAVQPDGRIVVAGGTGGSAFNKVFTVLRLLANGDPDPSFGTAGNVTIDFGGSQGAKSVAVQADGKIVVAGATQDHFAVARLNANGSLDSSFAAGGKITTDFGDLRDAASAVVLQPDGKIVAAGGTNSDLAVARYLPDNVGTPNQRFVEQIYWDLLRRPVDSSGLTSWTGLLERGLSRTQVATAIQSSLEYRALVVGDLYKLVLGRTVDLSGSTTWVSFLNRGGTAEQLEVILLGSDELFVAHGSNNDQGFLPALYQIALQRPIDLSGAQAWGQALQSGALARPAVTAAVLASLESDRLEVQSLYMQFLHRAADSDGLDAFTSKLQQGLGNELVGVLLISSAEYFSRV